MKKIIVNKKAKEFLSQNKIFLASLIVILFMYIFLYSSIGKDPFGHDTFDQYTRQAKAWTEGKISLEENLSYLEIAEYEGSYFVSFPPVPSVIMVPLYLLFDLNTPNTYMVTLYAIFSYLIVFSLLKRKTSNALAVFISAFFIFASSALVISVSGDVWFQAQMLGLLFTLLAIYLVTSKKKNNWYFSLMSISLAIGCRPLNIIYFVPILFILFLNLRKGGELKTKQNTMLKAKGYLIILLKYIWIPILVGGVLMVYNYVRFDSPFVFGHKYLPNFTNSSKQFGFQYFLNNLMCTFRLPIVDWPDIIFPKFDGFAFWMCCPFFIYAAIEFIARKKSNLDWIVIASFTLHFVFLLLHKGMGGHQFGTRYMIDLMPYALILIYNGKIKNRVYTYVLAAFGLMINVYGIPYHYLG